MEVAIHEAGNICGFTEGVCALDKLDDMFTHIGTTQASPCVSS
jgi:hypothetical protein